MLLCLAAVEKCFFGFPVDLSRCLIFAPIGIWFGVSNAQRLDRSFISRIFREWNANITLPKPDFFNLLNRQVQLPVAKKSSERPVDLCKLCVGIRNEPIGLQLEFLTATNGNQIVRINS